jgi:parallel beta-helix repeat protein
MLPPGRPGGGLPNLKLPLIIAVAAVVVIAAIFGALSLFHSSTTTVTTTSPTTIVSSTVPTSTTTAKVAVGNIDNCTTITKPGTYFLAHSINMSATQGPCIDVKSSNVRLLGNGNSVTGSGPYSGVPPYSYGIYLDSVSNVTVTGFRVLRFSYDIYFNGTKGSTASGDNFTKPTIAGVDLHESAGNNVTNNYVSQSDSSQGGIYLEAGSNNNLISNDTVSDNAYRGITVNSTGNQFSRINMLRNPVDIACGAGSVLRRSNAFSNSSCSTNQECEFASCTGNIAYNISSVVLSPGNVTSCGQIFYPGNYRLAADLNVSEFLNTSRPAEKQETCIRISSPNVNFTCAGRSITHAGIGISVAPTYSTNASDCVLGNDTYGIYAKGTFGSYLSNMTIRGSYYGIYLQNVTSGSVTNVNLRNGTYGTYLDLVNGVTFVGINAHDNEYGMYASSGGSDVFRNGALTNNSKTDLFCTPSTYNSSDNLLQNVACGVTDCNWAPTCTEHVLPQLVSYPLSACKQITVPGNYTITQNILAPKGTCFNITVSNVNFNCGGYSIIGKSSGNAFSFNDKTGISIASCNLNQFSTGINASNTRNVNFDSVSMSNVTQGVYVYNAINVNVANVTVKAYYSSAFDFQSVNGSTVTGDSALGGLGSASGFLFGNDTHDAITFDTSGPNPTYGFGLVNFAGDAFYNNTASGDMKLDYYCSPSSSGFYTNPLGVNNGLTKNTCRWLIAVPPVSQNPVCQAFSSAADVVLTSDLIYPYGNTCYSAYHSTSGTTGNGTTINCNGHTVLATHGGTFVSVFNASGVTLENCLLYNFTTAFSVGGISARIVNNTFLSDTSGVLVYNASFDKVSGNRFQNDTYGILYSNASYGSVLNNILYRTVNAIGVYGGSGTSLQNNTATNGTVGMYLSGSASISITKNLMQNMTGHGISCYGIAATNDVANRDFGGNSCSGNFNCTWVTSPLCKAS